MVFQNKSVSWKSLRAMAQRGPAKDHREYFGKEQSSSLLLSVPISDQESLKGVWLVLGPHYGDSYTQRSRCSARGPMEGKLS